MSRKKLSKPDQESGEIWYHNSEDRTYLLIELKDTVQWTKGKKPISRWHTYCFETGSCDISNFNSDAPDYDVWSHLA